jgi:hypothetical protein
VVCSVNLTSTANTVQYIPVVIRLKPIETKWAKGSLSSTGCAFYDHGLQGSYAERLQPTFLMNLLLSSSVTNSLLTYNRTTPEKQSATPGRCGGNSPKSDIGTRWRRWVDQFHGSASLLQTDSPLLLDSRLCGLLPGIEFPVGQPVDTEWGVRAHLARILWNLQTLLSWRAI